MIELNLLKLMSVRSNLDQYRHLLNIKTLSIQTIEIIKDYLLYFEQYDEAHIDFNKFKEFFFLVCHPSMNEKNIDNYKQILNEVHNIPIDGISCTQIIKAFDRQELYIKLHNDLDQDIDLLELKTKIDRQLEKENLIANDSDIDDMDLNKALMSIDRSNGLRWRLRGLQDHFKGGLIQGDFGIVAGYVDVGKTGFLCSEVSYMAEQLKDDQWIAWLNTEGNWEQIIPRIYSSTLNCTIDDLRKWPKDAIIKYTEKMKGNRNRIRILNFQRKSTKDVEKLLKQNPPSLLVFDLLDHINGFDKYLGKDGNATEKYGALYQWARTISTIYCPVLAITQLNGDGNNEAYPSITNLRGSRVDKQAAATFQLIIGGMEGNSTERYLSMPKNKINSNKGWRLACKFDPLRNRFND